MTFTKETFFHWWHKIAIILLTAHGLLGLWESLKFIIFEYQKFDSQLQLHQLESIEVNYLISKEIITVTSTLITFLFAIRLSKVKETTAHNIDLIVATVIIITAQFIQNYLIKLDIINIFIK